MAFLFKMKLAHLSSLLSGFFIKRKRVDLGWNLSILGTRDQQEGWHFLFDIQKSRSTLQRLIIDNQAMANTSRVVANLSMVKNPRELVDNNIGGVINAADPTAVVPMPTPPLSPNAFNTDELVFKHPMIEYGIPACTYRKMSKNKK